MRPDQADQLRDLIRVANAADYDSAPTPGAVWCSQMFALARAGVLDDLLAAHASLHVQAQLKAAQAKQISIPDTVTLECARDVLEAWASPGDHDLLQAMRALRKVMGLEPIERPTRTTPTAERQHCERVCVESGWGLATLDDQHELQASEIPDPAFVDLLMRERKAATTEQWVQLMHDVETVQVEMKAVRQMVEHIQSLPHQWLREARDIERFGPEPCAASGLTRAAEELLSVLFPV